MRTSARLAALAVTCAAALSLTGATAAADQPVAVVLADPSGYRWATSETEQWGAGRYLTYAVAVEDGLPYNPEDFAAEVRAVLTDDRSWAAHGDVTLRQVRNTAPDFVIRLSTPGEALRLCDDMIMLDGKPYLSCGGWPPFGIVINADRWAGGDAVWPGNLQSYRAQLVNHEMGHVLGHWHTQCTTRGQLAPFMTPLRESVGCLKSAWPYPTWPYSSRPADVFGM